MSKGGYVPQEAWVAPTLTNSWVNFGGLTDAGYMKDSLGFVHLRGVIKSGTMAAAAFTLPAGYRPAKRHQFPAFSNNAYGDVLVNTDGTVVPSDGSNVSLSLDGITFDTR